MKKWTVITKHIEKFEHIVQAETKEEAERIGVELSGSGEGATDYYWYDSEVYENTSDDEPINV